MKRALIVGGGIGGLAAAVALAGAGWQVEVLEQTPEFAEVGAGLTLWPNALRALDAIGLGERVRAVGLMETAVGLRDQRGRWLVRTDAEEMTRRFGAWVVVHRAELLGVLADALPAGVLRPGARVTGVRSERAGVAVTHALGESKADLLVGADGIRSVVREAFWPGIRPVYAGGTAWRMVLDRPGRQLSAGGEFWGRAEEFGLLQLSRGRVYMFAGARVPEGGVSPDGELAELRRRFAAWAEPIGSLLAEVDPARVLRHDLYHLPDLTTFVDGSVVLLGDAAHAMTPNMGQGGCQALEDAATLGVVLRGDDVPAALARYDLLRRKRSQSIAHLSRRAFHVGMMTSRAGVALRDNLTRLTPTAAVMRSFRPVFDWVPPVVPSSAGD